MTIPSAPSILRQLSSYLASNKILEGGAGRGKEAEQRVARMPSWQLSVGDSVELAADAPDNGCLGRGEVGNVCTVADE